MNLFKNYTKIYFRRFRKETVHYSVNIAGLAMGFAILFFILLFAQDEYGIDQFHSKKDRIYRVIENFKEDGRMHEYLSVSPPLADALKRDIPGIEQTAHMSYTGSHVIVEGDNRIADREWGIVTKEVFDILDFDIIAGNPKKSFEGGAGLILTEDAALRLFGKTDVIGEIVDESRYGSIEVIAMMNELPKNSSYQFKELYVADYSQWSEGWQEYIKNGWETGFAMTWVLLDEQTSPNDIYIKKDDFLGKYIDSVSTSEYDFYLQSLSDLHLGSTDIERGGPAPRLVIPSSTRDFVSITLFLGFLVLFIAALNYVNLSSVQALKRTLEASMRKINGATNSHLLYQLFFETLITILISFILSIGICVLLFPFFLNITGKQVEISQFFTLDFISYYAAIIAVIWIVSAVIPAIYYSRLSRTLLVLKNAFSGKGDLLRKILVGVQYGLSILLIIGSMIIYRQLNFVQSKNLGFDKENMIVLDINSGAARRNFKNIVNGIKEHPSVVNVASSSRVPGEWKYLPIASMRNNLTDEPISANHYGVDQYWLDTYNIQLKSGANFSGNDKTDSLGIIINEQAVRELDLENPIGSSIWVSEDDTVKMKVIGVVEDFHFESLYESIGPVVITNWNNHVFPVDYFTIKYSGNAQQVLEHIEEVNSTFDPGTPSEINFLDDQWARFYKAEESRSTIILIATLVSIIISAFGLFGLINFTVERKTKEIGVRKVLGASVAGIVELILKDYLIILMIAMTVAGPIAWWLFEDWLADFAYRINIGLDIFLIAFAAVLMVSFSTVLTRIFKIAKSNPVKSIKHE
ncbi:MAG: ABC transporter permease [Ekhidna sp.]